MPVVRARGLAFAYRDAVPLFSSVDFQLEPGFAGLVGADGAGKSTLLALPAGELEPDAGEVSVRPPGARVRLCAQSVEALGEPEARLADRRDRAACELRGRFDLDRAGASRWPTLSPGERKRWQLAAALADDPDVLLLDEPTNHLDGAARAIVIEAIARFRGVGIVVSHDRALLDRATRATVALRRGAVEVTPLPYSAARAEWDRAREAAAGERSRAVAALRSSERRLADARRDREAADRARSSSARMKGARDHDARSAGAKFRAERAEATRGRHVAVARADLARAAEAIPAFEVDPSVGRSVFVGWERPPRPVLLSLDVDAVRVAGAPLLRDVRVTLGREDRARVAGANGAGKTTLLEALLAASTLPPHRAIAVPQEPSVAEGRAALAEIRALAPAERGRTLSLVAALGVDPARLLASASPSPGEAKKALLALGLGRHAWALVLDEPTNHLDLPSIERLEPALAAYPGALLVVTHDDAFASRTTTTTWRVADGRVALE
jgi:ATPase subunit of ABC transporter with duplicated ATPase domains